MVTKKVIGGLNSVFKMSLKGPNCLKVVMVVNDAEIG